MNLKELNEIDRELKQRKEMIYIPKTLFKLGMNGRTMILYDSLNKIQWSCLNNGLPPMFNFVSVGNRLGFSPEQIKESMDELVNFGILKITQINEDNSTITFEIDYTFILSNI